MKVFVPWTRNVLPSTQFSARAGAPFTESITPLVPVVTSAFIALPRDGPAYLPTNEVASPTNGFGCGGVQGRIAPTSSLASADGLIGPLLLMSTTIAS